jgi:type II secretory pathway pseudopilin PulG
VLLAVAFLGIALAAIGTVWTTTLRREREAQLLFVGDAFRSAIASYYANGRQLPQELEDLVEDQRTPLPRRYLRRIYLDPMTGRADWQLLRDPDGGIFGVASSSLRTPLKRANFPAEDAEFEKAERYCDWLFEFTPRRDGARGTAARARPAR